MRSLAAAVALLTMLLAGCSGDGPKADAPDAADFTELGLEATSTTGVIRGVVVDVAIKPVAGATVVLASLQQTATTQDDGLFGFDGLEPGTYFVEVSRAGYGTVQQSVDVEAGVDEPSLVRVQLTADPATAPFWQAYQFEGFIACSARYLVEGRNFCSLVDENDATLFDVELEGVPTFAQGELVWDSTQALGGELSFNWRRDDTSADYIDAEGPSPLLLKANHTLLADNEVGAGQPLRAIVFTAHLQETEPPCAPEVGCAWGVGVQVNQKFTLYEHVFYNMVPPEGWTFGQGGDPPVQA